MVRAKKDEIALLFLDAAHFVMGGDFLGYIYGRERRLIRTWSGRKRYNVLGAMDFMTVKVHTVTNDTYITADEVCEMFRKLRAAYADKEIHLVLDNARYQKCMAVQESASSLNIHLEYIPAYSPNLNLIERLWRFVKGELRTKYYDNFGIFCEKIDSIIRSTTQANKAKVKKLIGEKIQLFDNLSPISDSTYSFKIHSANMVA